VRNGARRNPSDPDGSRDVARLNLSARRVEELNWQCLSTRQPNFRAAINDRGNVVMNSSLLVAAPLMIAAIVMAFRFVGCGIDSDPLPYNGNGENRNGNGDDTKPLTVRVNLSSTGTLTGTASFPGHDPYTQPYNGAGTYAFAIPFWCTRIDLVLLGAGGGGSYAALSNGVGGGAGEWKPVTLQRGTDIAWATTTINVTVGQGGSGGTPGAPSATPGGDTTASWDTTTATATGGGAGASTIGQSGDGPSPTMKSVGDATLTAGNAQSTLAAAGNRPGGGGAGGDVLSPGGAGADGAAIIVASQS
jgi:hypothetical protein